jgi:hypothetical protein
MLAARAVAGPICDRLKHAINVAGNIHAGASGQQHQRSVATGGSAGDM